MGDLGSIPGLGRSPGEGNWGIQYSILQYSDLENSMDCIAQGVRKSWTQLSDCHTCIGKEKTCEKHKHMEAEQHATR